MDVDCVTAFLGSLRKLAAEIFHPGLTTNMSYIGIHPGNTGAADAPAIAGWSCWSSNIDGVRTFWRALPFATQRQHRCSDSYTFVHIWQAPRGWKNIGALTNFSTAAPPTAWNYVGIVSNPTKVPLHHYRTGNFVSVRATEMTGLPVYKTPLLCWDLHQSATYSSLGKHSCAPELDHLLCRRRTSLRLAPP
ncbi:hypothetical protein BKA93DRAFT_296176 [Sparassis latifolia]